MRKYLVIFGLISVALSCAQLPAYGDTTVPVIVTTETQTVTTTQTPLVATSNDTASAAAANEEPWWFKYFVQIFVLGITGVASIGMPFFIAWRKKQSTRTQGILDAAVESFNYAEYLAAVTPDKYDEGVKKMSAALEKARQSYFEQTGEYTSDSTLSKIKSVIEKLVYNQNAGAGSIPTATVSSKQ